MKNAVLILFFLVIFVFNTLAQSNFDIGFKKGFAIGYCYSNDKNAGSFCNPPLPPLPPLPQINENYDNYNHGYNRGFLWGIDRRRADDNKSSNGNSEGFEPPKFNPYVQQNPIISLTPEERAAFYAARARQDQATAEAIGYLLEHIFTSTPEGRMQRAEAKIQREKDLLRIKDEHKKRKEDKAKQFFVGSNSYNKCKTSKTLWLVSALVSSGVGTIAYLQSDKYYTQYQTATTDAGDLHQKVELFDMIYPVAFGVAGFCTLEFIIKAGKQGKAKRQSISFIPQPLNHGAGLGFAYTF